MYKVSESADAFVRSGNRKRVFLNVQDCLELNSAMPLKGERLSVERTLESLKDCPDSPFHRFSCGSKYAILSLLIIAGTSMKEN